MPAKTLEAPARVPLYTPLATRTSAYPFTKDCRLYNGYAEMEPMDKAYWIYKRVGIGRPQSIVGPGLPSLGIYTESGTGDVFAIYYNGLYKQQPGGSFTLVGAVDTSGPYFWETSTGQAANERYVVFSNGTKVYVYSASPATFQEITTGFAAGPPVGRPVYLDGFIYIMDEGGNIWNQATAQHPTLPFSAQVPANNEPDLGVTLVKQLNYILALKQYSTEVFYDANNPTPGSPLGHVPDSQMPFGCLAATSVQTIDSTALWITSNETISPQIVQVDNLVPKIVSTPNVDRILDNIAWSDIRFDIRSWALKHSGHRFYGLTMVKNNMTLVYDLDQLAWYIWTDPKGNYWPIVGMAYSLPAYNQPGIHIAQHILDGSVYQLDGDYEFPSDNGIVYPVDIYTPNFDAGIDRRKQVNVLRFLADQTHGSILQVRHSDDDYLSWSNYRSVDLGVERPVLTNDGTFRRRAYHIRHQCNTSLRIRSVDMQMDVGSL